MKRRYNILLLFLILIGPLFVLSGCGGAIGGAPGSDSGDTGILLTHVSIVGEDVGTDSDDEVDVALHLCPPALTELEDGLYEHDGIMTIGAKAVGFDDVFPASVEQCTITYLKGNENPDAPIIESHTVYPNCKIVERENNVCRTIMFPIDRKWKWWDDFNGLNFTIYYPTHYVARYKCTFINNYGKEGSFQVEYDIYLADWDNC